MTRYFIAANFWLVFGIVAIFGDTNATMMSSPAQMSSFFGKGYIYSSAYTFIEVAMFIASASFFVLTWMTRKKS
jgi:hypothetical protein